MAKNKGGNSTSTIDPRLFDLASKNFQGAQAIANKPFKPFTGPLVAAPGAATQQAQGLVLGGAMTAGKPAMDNAVNSATSLTNFTPTTVKAPKAQAAVADAAQADRSDVRNLFSESGMGGIDSYMNPYIDQAVNRAGADIDRQRQVSLNGNSAAATLAGGAFDGARHGVVDAETNRAYGDIFATTAANMRNTGFNNATSAMMTDRDRALQAGGANQTADLSLANQNAGMANATNLFNAGNKTQVSQGNAQNALTGQVANQNANTQAGGLRLGASDLLGGLSVDQLKSYLTGTQAIGNVGAQQDQNAQANINAQYEQYLRQQQYPYMNQQMLNSALGMFGGMSGTQQFQPRQTPVLNAMSSGKLFEKIKLF